ncbi:MAG: hypothetical protein ACU0CO_00175 [Shimia sp.]
MEFERYTTSTAETRTWLGDIGGLCEAMRAEGYDIVQLPRDRARYFSAEFLFTRAP